MKKVICAIIIVMLISCVALASQYGAYNGFDIVKVFVGGNEVVNDVPAVIMDGRTMVPIRVISEQLGMSVDWDSSTNTAVINDYSKFQVQLYVDYSHMLTRLEMIANNVDAHAFNAESIFRTILVNKNTRETEKMIQDYIDDLDSLSDMLNSYKTTHLNIFTYYDSLESKQLLEEYMYYFSIVESGLSYSKKVYDTLDSINIDGTSDYYLNKYLNDLGKVSKNINEFYSQYYKRLTEIFEATHKAL